MNDLLVLYTIIAFITVVVIQAIERYFYGEQARQKENKLLEENSRLIKAVISKNAQDYVMTASIDKVAPEEKAPQETDLLPEESLSDEEFMKAIHKDVKQ